MGIWSFSKTTHTWSCDFPRHRLLTEFIIPRRNSLLGIKPALNLIRKQLAVSITATPLLY